MPAAPVPNDSYPLPPTRLLSWEALVSAADPNWRTEGLRPWVYEFSNGRRFLDDPTVYTD